MPNHFNINHAAIIAVTIAAKGTAQKVTFKEVMRILREIQATTKCAVITEGELQTILQLLKDKGVIDFQSLDEIQLTNPSSARRVKAMEKMIRNTYQSDICLFVRDFIQSFGPEIIDIELRIALAELKHGKDKISEKNYVHEEKRLNESMKILPSPDLSLDL